MPNELEKADSRSELEGAGAAQRADDSRFRGIVDDIDALIIVLSAEGEVELVNRQTLDYFGKTLDDVRAWQTNDIVHPDDRPELISSWFRAVESERPFQTDYRIRRFDGIYKWYRSRALPVRDENARVVRWYCVKTEVDDQKKAEALLAGEKRLLEMVANGEPLNPILAALCGVAEQIFGDCHCGVTVVDADGSAMQLAPSLPPSYQAGFPSRFATPDGGPCAVAARSRAQVIVPNVVLDERWAASGWRELARLHGLAACWSTPVLARGGSLLGTFAVYHHVPAAPTLPEQDVIARFTHLAGIAIERAQGETALNRLRSELSHVSRVMTVGALTASIAHELNQPLSGIVTNASTCLRKLAEDVSDLEGVREIARRMIRDANRAAEVISRLRALLKKGELERRPLDVNEAISEVIAMCKSELFRGKICVHVDLERPLPPAMGDRVQLQQVLLNLILNAAEAMHTAGERRLSVKSERACDDLRVTVSDSGVGLDPQALPKLFDAFYSTKPDGMGVGLSVSRAIIESHGGRVWAQPNDGPGASFIFSIPLSGIKHLGGVQADNQVVARPLGPPSGFG